MSLPICIMRTINLKVLCKHNRFGHWNSCKQPNFVNVAALVLTLSTKMADSKIKTHAQTYLSYLSMQLSEKSKSDKDS